MSISAGYTITWSDFATTCYSAIVNACCNIDSFKNVPTRLQNGQGQFAVKTQTTGIPDSQSTQTFTWYANPSNGIALVTSANVISEWNTFLTAAGIDVRSNKIIQAKELGLAIGLYQQFMSYHLKPVYSRRQVYNTVESQTVFQGIRYITGTCTPKYVLTAIDPSNIPEVTDADIISVVRQSFLHDGVNYGMWDSEANPVIARCYLS